MRNVLPILLIIASAALFVTFIDPHYQSTKGLQAQIATYDDALNKSKDLQKIRDQLLSRYNTFSSDNLDRLKLLLPDNVDNIRLVLDIDTIASHYGMAISNLKIAQSSPTGQTFTGDTQDVQSVDLTFTVSADYNNFLKFIRDLEDSLRIVDIRTIDFTVNNTKPTATNYTVTVRTYWLP